MNNSDDKKIDKESLASDASSIIMPGIPESLTPKIEKPKEPDTPASKKKKIPKKFILIFGVLGIIVLAFIIFMIISSSSTPKVISNPKVDTINGVDDIKEKALTNIREKNTEVKLIIKELGSYLDTIEPLNYSIIEIDTNNIKNYDIFLTSNESLEFYYLRYYNMDYNYTDLASLNKYDKIYVVVVNKSKINSYSYQLNYSTKKTYNAENYNNYNVKITYTASSGDVSNLTNVNAIYDEVHQRRYIRVPVYINNVGNSTKIIYEDLSNGISYTKLPTSTIWTKSQCDNNNLNLKELEEYLINGKEGVTKLSQSVYKLDIKKEQIKPLLYGIEPLVNAPSTITIKNGRISKIVYEFKNNYKDYKKLVMTIEISDVNKSGDVTIPKEATK